MNKTIMTLLVASMVLLQAVSGQPGLMDIQGSITLSDSDEAFPRAGTIRWNSASEDFEGYNGEKWMSLTLAAPLDEKYLEQSVYNDDQITNDQRLGWSVEIDGDYAFIGAPNAITIIDIGGSGGYWKEGVVHVYRFNGYTWEYMTKLSPTTIDQKDGFGFSISAHDGRLAISSVELDDFGEPVNNSSNAVYMYELYQGRWQQTFEILDPEGVQQDGFGYDLDLSGDYLVIGTPWRDVNGIEDSGCAYAYKYDDHSNTWDPFGSVLHNGQPAEQDQFGHAVAINDDIVIIGAPGKMVGNNSLQGECSYFSRTFGMYEFQQTLHLPNPSALDNFGFSLDISDQNLIIGTPGREAKGKLFAGSVALYGLNNADQWVFEVEIFKPNPSHADSFGYSVSRTQALLAVGASQSENTEIGVRTGSTILYHRPDDIWIQKQEIFDSEIDNKAFSGSASCIGSNHLLMGSPRAYAEDDYDRPGKAVFYRFQP